MTNVFIVWYEAEVEGQLVRLMWRVYAFIADAQKAQDDIIKNYGYRAWITEELVAR